MEQQLVFSARVPDRQDVRLRSVADDTHVRDEAVVENRMNRSPIGNCVSG
jgi:hypothetical protein